MKKIIIYLKKEEEKHQNKSKEYKKRESENEAIELLLNSFLKHPTKNIKKEYKIDILYCIIVNFKSQLIPYYEELLSLVIDSFKQKKIQRFSKT